MKNSLRTIRRSANYMLDLLVSLTGWVAILCVLGIIGLTGTEVISRWVFNFTTKASEELTGYMLVGISFLGLAYTFVRGGHLTVDVVFQRLSPYWQRIMRVFNGIVGTSFCVMLTYFGSKLAAQTIEFSSYSPTTLSVPMVIPTILVPIGASVMSLVMLAHTIKLIRLPKVVSESQAINSVDSIEEREP